MWQCFPPRLVLITFALALGDVARGDDPPGRAFLDDHCVGCHGSANKKGGLDFDALGTAFDDPAVAAKWIRIVDRVRAGEMPPASKKKPSKGEIDSATAAISDALIAGETARRAKNGRSTVRRLNRAEFENTIRDLLQLPWLEVKDLIPDDGRAGGYSKSAAALDVSPVLLSKYGEAIDKALDAATAKYAIPPEINRRTMYANQMYDFKILLSGGDAVMITPDKKYDVSRFPMPAATNADGKYPASNWFFGGKYKGLREAEQGGAFKEPSTVGMTRTFGEAFRGRFNFAPMFPGKYRIGISAWSYWWEKGELKPAPRTGAVGVYCGSQLIGFFDAPSLTPTWSETVVEIEPDQEKILRAAGASFLDAHVYFSQGQIKAYSGPGVAIDKLFVEGPLYDEWPPSSHRILFGTLPVVAFHKLPPGQPKPHRENPHRYVRGADNSAGRVIFGTTVSDDPSVDARRLLSRFLPRAFRRPVASAEVERYASIFDERITAGECFEDALKVAYKAALLSPRFLFLNEPVGPLDGYAIATRLSYFLWNSCPDDALLSAAKAGKLAAEGLRTEIDRLLADTRADRFYQDFLDQWLDLRDIDATSPDKQLYPEFQPYLEDAIRNEPREFFKEVVRRNLPSSQLVETSLNMVNQRLAEHYGMPGVSGARFRRADFDPRKSRRGGLLTMAAVCKVTANGTTTSPVKRGAWVMKKILGTPPQAPPPDVPAIEPDVKGATTIREQLARHRSNAACAGCHAQFDPPGFALESYDPIGGWRDFYRGTEAKKLPDFARIFQAYLTPEGQFKNHVGFRDGPPVDPSGELADGRKFAGLLEYQKLILSDRQVFSRNLANQLVTYATGAPVGFADRRAVELLLKKAGSTDPGVRNLIYEVIQSPLFLTK